MVSRAVLLSWTALCVAVLAWTVCFPLTNTDIWWHLSAGRWILEQGRIPRVDPFAAGTAGTPWIDLHWLFQVAALGVHRLGGVAGLVLTKVALVALGGAALVIGVGRERPEHYWPLAALFTVASVSTRPSARFSVITRKLSSSKSGSYTPISRSTSSWNEASATSKW